MFVGYTDENGVITSGAFKGWVMIPSPDNADEKHTFTLMNLDEKRRSGKVPFSFEVTLNKQDFELASSVKNMIELHVLNAAYQKVMQHTLDYMTKTIASLTEQVKEKGEKQYGSQVFAGKSSKEKMTYADTHLKTDIYCPQPLGTFAQFEEMPEEYWDKPIIRREFAQGYFGAIEKMKKQAGSIELIALQTVAAAVGSKFASFVYGIVTTKDRDGMPTGYRTEAEEKEVNEIYNKVEDFDVSITKELISGGDGKN